MIWWILEKKFWAKNSKFEFFNISNGGPSFEFRNVSYLYEKLLIPSLALNYSQELQIYLMMVICRGLWFVGYWIKNFFGWNTPNLIFLTDQIWAHVLSSEMVHISTKSPWSPHSQLTAVKTYRFMLQLLFVEFCLLRDIGKTIFWTIFFKYNNFKRPNLEPSFEFRNGSYLYRKHLIPSFTLNAAMTYRLMLEWLFIAICWCLWFEGYWINNFFEPKIKNLVFSKDQIWAPLLSSEMVHTSTESSQPPLPYWRKVKTPKIMQRWPTTGHLLLFVVMLLRKKWIQFLFWVHKNRF